MSTWYRVFGMNDVQPEPQAVLDCLGHIGIKAAADVHEDEWGWFRIDLAIPGEAEPLPIARYLTREEGVRAELNTWAAWIESLGEEPVHMALMRQIIGTVQLFTWQSSGEENVEHLHGELCQFLAQQTAGIYQADTQGFFAADGRLLVRED
jgi:hypothetical protein